MVSIRTHLSRYIGQSSPLRWMVIRPREYGAGSLTLSALRALALTVLQRRYGSQCGLYPPLFQSSRCIRSITISPDRWRALRSRLLFWLLPLAWRSWLGPWDFMACL